MTKFLELKKKYESLVDVESNYWTDLRDTVSEILEGFCTYLGLPEPEAEGDGRWVHFGRVGLDGFEKCGPEQMERHKNLLHFALLVNLSLEPTDKPNSQPVLSLRICKVGSKYQVSSTDAAIYPSPFARGEYGHLFAAMYEGIEKTLTV